jgi:hypothetical protein
MLPVSVFEYAFEELGRPVKVEENHSLMNDCEAAAGAPSPLSLRGAREVAALSDEDAVGPEREERASSPVRRREDEPNTLMYQQPWFVAESIW